MFADETMDLTLKKLFSIKGCKFEYSGPPEILSQKAAGVSIDTRTLQPNEIYFALRGERLDGHDFVDDAFEKQALAAVVERGWWKQVQDSETNLPVFIVEDSLTALQEAARDYRKKFSLPVLGLTGTNGKTTTKEMIATILANVGSICKTEGNLNNHIGLPLSLFSLNRGHKVMVAEMGMNHFGEIARLCEIADPQFGLITNIGRGHLEFLGDVAGVAKAKMELFEHLQPDGTAFINLNDPLVVKHAPKLKNSVTFGFMDGARVIGQRLEPDESGFPRMEVEGETITLNLFGEHNLSNALAAVAVGLEFGVTIKNIKDALEHVKIPGKRMEIIRRNKFLILNDSYNANPDSTLAALRILQQTACKGKRIFVFGDMLELGESAPSEHARIGEALRDFDVDSFFAFGPQCEHAVKRCQKKFGEEITAKHFEDKTKLASELKSVIEDGDVLLVKGSRGMKMEEVIEGLV